MKVNDYKFWKGRIETAPDDSTGAFDKFVQDSSSMDQEPRPMFANGQLVRPNDDGSRPGYNGLDAKKKSEKALDLQKINNPSQEALDEIATIVDKYTKTSDVAGKEIKHLSKDGAVDKIFKEVTTKGYKRPSVAKVLFKQVLDSKGITTYDNYRTNKIVFTLQDVLRKNNGNILSIKPSAVAEILPEFAIEGKKGGKGIPIFRTFLNYLEGSERLINRSGLEKPKQIAGKSVDQIINEMKQNFLDIGEGRARGNFTVFEETKLLEKIGLENPKATANELKKLYEKAGGNSFRERVNTLYLAKTGQVTNKTDGGKSIIDAVRSGEITNKLPDSLRNSFRTYVKDYNFARMTRFAAEETDPDLIKNYTKTANIFTKNNLEKMGVPKGLVAEHGLPISAYDRGVADKSTRLKIDGFVTKEINNWKAKNFDFPVFRLGGLADQYKNASKADKPKIQAQIEEKLKLVKNRTPELVKNITFDFTDGKFTASNSTPVISNDVIPNLIKTGANVNQTFNIEAKIKELGGKEKLTQILTNGSGTGAQRTLLREVLTGANTILKGTSKFIAGALNPIDFFRLKNLIGLPAAIAAVAFDTVAIADDVIRKGQPFDVAAGNEFLTQFLDLNTESKQAQRILDDKGSDLSPAAKKYAQGLVDIGKYENLEKEKRNLLSLTEGQARPEDLEKIDKQLKILETKLKTFREDGALDYNAAVNELGINEEQSEYIGEPKKAGMFYYAADDTNTIPKYPFLTEDMGTGQSRSDGFYRNADGNRIKVNEYGYATKGNIFDIPGKTGAIVDRKFPYGETDQGRNPALLTEGEKIFRAETKQPAKYQKPFTYKDFNYQSKALSDEQYAKALKYYQDQGFIKPGQKLEDVNIPKGYNTRIVNGKEYDPPKTFLQDTTEFFNIGDKWKQALYQPGMLGANQKFAGGGIAGLSGGDKSGRPPESGPASQGLRSLFNNGKKR